MRILVSSYFLDLSGTPTYTLALYNELIRRGHDAVVYSPKSGPLAEKMRVVTDFSGLDVPDAIIAQQNVCAVDMRAAFPDVPMVFSAHGILPEMEQPPLIAIQRYTAINEDVFENLVERGVDPDKVDIVRDFIDTDRFSPAWPLSSSAKRVLFISNFKKWKTYAVVRNTCQILGIELKAVGAPYGRSYEVEKEINWADLVISVARGILEGMSCGRPVISFNQRWGDGYLTPAVYMESRTRNFSGKKCRHAFDVEGLAGEIGKYDPGDGIVNRNLVLEYHGHVGGVDKILEIVNGML